MKPIQMVDLQGQYLAIKKEIDEAIAGVITSAAFINGPPVKDFAQHLSTYLDARHVIPCANGTDALQVALMALDLAPGDEVITTNFTFIATVEAIALLKLKPVLVDVDPLTFNIDTSAIRPAITGKTKAIIPVHLFGQASNMTEIVAIAREYNLKILEDAAQALGASYSFGAAQRKLGTIGDIGCTSFFPSKNLGCYGDGGALFTNDDALGQRLKSLVNHGSTVKYHHETIGVNSRLDTIQAAILDVKLKYLDQYNERRQWAAQHYDKAFAPCPHIRTPAREPRSTHVFHQYTIVIDNATNTDVQKYLAERQIPSMIYYPVPMHAQQAFKQLVTDTGTYPVSDALSRSVLSLPMHTELGEEQLQYISTNVLSYFS